MLPQAHAGTGRPPENSEVPRSERAARILCARRDFRAISSLTVVNDVPASPPPRALILARKPLAREIS